MRRLLGILLYYFGWQQTMRWTFAAGCLLLLLGILLPAPVDRLPYALSVAFTGVFPLMFAPIAYRQLVANRHLQLVPRLELLATLGLLLLAVIVALFAVSILELTGRIADDALLAVGVLAFSLASLYLLLMQWIICYRLAPLVMVLLALVLLRLVGFGDLARTIGADGDWRLTLTAVLAWAWLIWLARSRRTPQRPAAFRISNTGAAGTEGYPLAIGRRLDQGKAGDPGLLLLRGMSAGRASRWLLSAIFLLSVPLTLALVFWLFGPVLDDPGDSPIRPGVLLLTSWLGLLFHTLYYYREWPARLRLLWLRAAGDRRGGWCRLEQLLVQDALQIVVLAVGIALAGRLFSDLPDRDLLIYVIACAATVFGAAYLTIWLRARSIRRLSEVLSKLLSVTLVIVLMFVTRSSGTLAVSLWLLPVLIAGALWLRTLARNSMTRVDWCIVRPEIWRRPTGA